MKPLSPADLETIGLCLRAVARGPYLRARDASDDPRRGSQERMTLRHDEVAQIARRWPDVDLHDATVALAVINTLVRLLGCARGQDDKWTDCVAASNNELREILRRVRSVNVGTRWAQVSSWAHCYAELPAQLAVQLARVPASTNDGLEYRPCRVRLADGRMLDTVYVVEAFAYFNAWGVWPEDGPGKRSVRVEDVREIHDSPVRLPQSLANQLYEVGESGMGYLLFTAEFRDGMRQAYVTGNAVDFIVPPPGQKASDATRVTPHEGRYGNPIPSPDYWWCLFTKAA